ncbi:unnamed protein product [Acanthoscelides obtectus]|uniref:Uncharacterized protein n=1 Tax=Acanthoscelides obtectus TaxID=200917 RepID=A0A9P0NXY8_ACAOB|nr:unnamed protein product [Acanthoscelides obtectus]CAK1631580.1 hypothetical protein AOBTE_LOCUS7016 [Acanthoscelides obtectus]
MDPRYRHQHHRYDTSQCCAMSPPPHQQQQYHYPPQGVHFRNRLYRVTEYPESYGKKSLGRPLALTARKKRAIFISKGIKLKASLNTAHKERPVNMFNGKTNGRKPCLPMKNSMLPVLMDQLTTMMTYLKKKKSFLKDKWGKQRYDMGWHWL